MKNKIAIIAVLVLWAGTARAQFVVSDPASLAQGIVNSSNEMVQTSSSARTLVQNFRETQKLYNQGKEYYDRLRGVNNLVRDARRVQQCILMLGDISKMYVSNYEKMLSDEHFTVRELSAIARGYTVLLQEGTYVLRDLQSVVNPSGLSMTDKERLDVIDKCYRSMSKVRSLTSLFTRSNISVALQRARQQNDVKRSLALYGADEDKYW